MGQLLLCKTGMAGKPFWIEGGKLNIYSLEELFYYLYHASFVDKRDLICDEFIYWIRDELKQDDVSAQLYESYVSGKGLLHFIAILENICGYLNENELKKLNINLNRFDHMSPLELGKQSADDMLKKGKLIKAIKSYRALLTSEYLGTADDVVKGDIYHNLGVCYSRFYDFGEAENCFIMAYRSNHRAESLAEAVDCAVLSGDKKLLERLTTSFNSSFAAIEREVKRASAIHTDSLSRVSEQRTQPDASEYMKQYIYSCEE